MLIFEAWDMIAMSVEHSAEMDNGIYADKLRKAFKKCDGLMDMLLMKIDSMEDEITITREDISEALGYEK